MLNIKIRKQIISETLLYTLVWSIVFLVPFMNAGLMFGELLNVDEMFLTWLKILPFYLLFIIHNHLLLPFLYYRKRYVTYIVIGLLLNMIVFFLVEWYEQSNIAFSVSIGYGHMTQPAHISLVVFPLYGNIIACAMMFFANLVFKNMYRSMQSDEDRAQLDKQSIQAEMYYLKYQINPHFFMNTLNNIHALVDIDSEGAKRSIIELSNMMRYVVYDSETDGISLKKDINFIENYIALMRIRYPEDIDIRFNYPSNLSGRIVVPPLIFIVFVENAFKHGVSYSNASYIHIDIEHEDNYVVARFCNSVHVKPTEHKPGIGLDNVCKRLDLLYGSNYDMKIQQDEKEYCVTLKIPTIK